jgi:rare lipoprotein A
MCNASTADAKEKSHRSIKHNKVTTDHHHRSMSHKRVYVKSNLTYKKIKHNAITEYNAVGLASYYGYESGARTAMGTRFKPLGLSAAHRTLPLASMAMVTNLRNHKSVVVLINDRGPHIKGRIIDLSLGAARVLGITGVALVSIKLI